MPYLDYPPSVADLRRLMTLLAIDDPREMVRTGEPAYGELGLDEATAEEVQAAGATHPVPLQRPIVVAGDRAVIARR